MKTKYIGKNIQLRDHFKQQVDKKFRRLDKYFGDDVTAIVTMATAGTSRRVEVTIRIPGSDTVLRSERKSQDMLNAVDDTVAALESQMRRFKTRLRNRYQGNASIRFDSVQDLEEEQETEAPIEIVRTKKLELAPMSAEEAVMQMNLSDHDFYAFLDVHTKKFCVVYRRHAGNFGLLKEE